MRVFLLAPPPRGHHQRPRAERQHLHVVSVVAEAVARDERGRERRVEAGRHRGPSRPAGEKSQPIQRGDEPRIENHGDERERTRGIDDGRERGRQVRFQAAAVRHVGNEHEMLGPVADVEGDDARQRAVGATDNKDIAAAQR